MKMHAKLTAGEPVTGEAYSAQQVGHTLNVTLHVLTSVIPNVSPLQ